MHLSQNEKNRGREFTYHKDGEEALAMYGYLYKNIEDKKMELVTASKAPSLPKTLGSEKLQNVQLLFYPSIYKSD